MRMLIVQEEETREQRRVKLPRGGELKMQNPRGNRRWSPENS